MAQKPFKLIVGLGNPGPEHAMDRHNVGYWFVDALADAAGARFKNERKYHGDICRIGVDDHEVRMLKPTTYMNRSGQATQALASYLKIQPGEILVVHDDLDLSAGDVRLKYGGGHGGHNGLRDVIRHLGKDFCRARIGISHPGHKDDVIDYVLKRASSEDEDKIIDAIRDLASVLPVFLNDGEQAAMKKLHSRGTKPKPYKKAATDSTDGNSKD
jgi:PTH1 family peptidyl-tRNA hydrolase